MVLATALALCATVGLVAADDPCLKTGALCRLKAVTVITGVVWVPTATSERAMDEFDKSLAAGDKEGLIELLRAGGLLDTKPGTTIRVLDFSLWKGRTEARLTSGKYAGRKVWVRSRWVEP